MAHDYPDLFPHPDPVAVDRTVAAGGFAFLEGAATQAQVGVAEEFPAIAAQLSKGLMLLPAEKFNQQLDRPPFPVQPGMFTGTHYLAQADAARYSVNSFGARRRSRRPVRSSFRARSW